MNRDELPDILTIPQISSYLHISKSKGYQLAHLPGFPTIFLGGTIRVRKDKFFAWLDTHEQEIEEIKRSALRSSWPGSEKEA